MAFYFQPVNLMCLKDGFFNTICRKKYEEYLNFSFEANRDMKSVLKKENIKKFVFLPFVFLLFIGHCHAQWTEQDSLKLKRLLEKEGNIELNPNALRSMESPHLYRQHFDFDATLPTSPFPQLEHDTIMRRFRMSLQPYRGFYLYNKDPLTGAKVSFPGSMDENKYGALRRYIVPEQNGVTNYNVQPTFLGQSMKDSLNYAFEQLFNRQFWNFRQRRTAQKTLAALSAYGNSEQKKGRYEYFQIDNEEYRLEFTGKDSIRSCIEVELQSRHPVTKGLLYFRYTEMGRGTFTYYLPDGNDKHGTFSTNGRRYVLFYEGQEIIITLERWGGSFYTLRRDLTLQWRPEYNAQELEKVQIALDVMRVFRGQDR